MIRFITILFIAYFTLFSNMFADDTPKVDNKDFLDNTALHDAIRSKKLELVKFLLDRGADINQKNKYNQTPLHLAVIYKDHNITSFLLENNANVNTSDIYGDSPLIDAVRNNDSNLSKLLICANAKRDIWDNNDISALHYSSKNKNLYLTKLLTTKYIELFCQDKIVISINDEGNSTKEKTPKICGKIDEGYISDINLTFENEDNMVYSTDDISIDNENHTWCGKVKEPLAGGIYVVRAKASDNVINESLATVNKYIYEKPGITINKYDKAINIATPKICGTIKGGHVKDIALEVFDGANQIGKYNSIVDNKQKTWCSNIDDSLKTGTYKVIANAVDMSDINISVEENISIELINIIIDIDDTSVYNDNTPQICGKLLKGDISKVEIELISKDTNLSQGVFNAKVDLKNKTWCSNVDKEIENGDYVIVASGYDDKGNIGLDKSSTKIYRIVGLYEALQDEFEDDFSKWDAELDKDTLTFRFKDPSALFNPGKTEMNEKFKLILDDFFPRYVKSLQKFKEQIQKVRLEGHSSSEHSRARDDEERFELNRVISQERAESAINYAKSLDSEVIKNDKTWIDSTFIPVGMSYSKLVYNEDGSENKELSRRVEIRINTKDLNGVEETKDTDVVESIPTAIEDEIILDDKTEDKQIDKSTDTNKAKEIKSNILPITTDEQIIEETIEIDESLISDEDKKLMESVDLDIEIDDKIQEIPIDIEEELKKLELESDINISEIN